MMLKVHVYFPNKKDKIQVETGLVRAAAAETKLIL